MAKKRTPLSDSDILGIVRAEREAALGDGDNLSEDRARAYDYLFGDPDRGRLKIDIPPEPGQSKAVSSDLSDAVETVLPDLIEIFTGGDDVVEFSPVGPEDEEQARQETDYVNHVFYNDNQGWLVLYENFKDALISKTGVFKWWWEECEEWDEFVFEDKSEEEWRVIRSEIRKGAFELADIEEDEVAPNPQTGLYTIRGRRRETYGKARVIAVPPEDFFVDRGAKSIATAIWAGHRSRVPAYDLIEQGFDPERVDLLKDYDIARDEDQRARRFEEDDEQQQEGAHNHRAIRRVEVVEYHIWLDADGDGKVECWKVITGNDDTVLLDKERIAGIQYAVNCPYPVTHRFYGRSLADLLIEVQKIKTTLTRMMLNAYYFGVNPRPEIDLSKADKVTISDLLNNRPGRPIRTRGENAINWRTPPIVGDAVLPALEYFSTVAEGRTGVVRNAQGLNPDTLHDTAKGAMELMGAAQRRVRMIARIFAETGVKDMFLGLHDLIVRHARKQATVRLRNKWVEVDPNKWARRKDLRIDVGLGANTKTGELQFWGSYLTILQNAAAAGVAVGPDHLFNAVKRYLKAGNVKNPEMYFPEPEEAAQQQGGPDPETLKVQGELQIKQQEAQAKLQLEQQKFQFEAALALFKAQAEAGLAEKAAETEARLESLSMQRRADLEEFKARSDAQTKTMSAAISAKTKTEAANAKISNVRFGGGIG